MRNKVLIRQFIQSAAKHALLPALKLNGQEYGYAFLNDLAASLARVILSRNRKPRQIIAVWGSASIAAYAGIPGVLMASGAYVPLNPRFPVARNRFILERSSAEIIILDRDDFQDVCQLFQETDPKPLLIFAGTDQLPEGLMGSGFEAVCAEYATNIPIPDISTMEHDMAYLMFTSGSTGVPKGVPVANYNVIAYLSNLTGMMDFSSSDRFSQTFDLTFDLSVHDLFACWLSGACLCIPSDRSALFMAKYIREEKISVWFSVPSQAVLLRKMRLLRENAFPELRYSLFCGEPLLIETATEWAKAAPKSRIYNLYGPTETTIAISTYFFNPAEGLNKSRNGILSIGKIFQGHDFRITSQEEGGLLQICGDQVVKGYYFDDKATAAGFIPDGGKYWYNTGDLVEMDEDGDLFFLGRNDYEIKISGYRVNILEIEHAIRENCRKNAVAVPVKDTDGSVKAIVALIEDPGDELKEDELRQALAEQLPWYMIPASFRKIKHIPLNENGKTDRQRCLEL